MTDEADHKRKLVKEINLLPRAYACRIEDRWAVGRLDLIIKLPAHPWIWAEGKMVVGNLFGPSQRQWEEGEKLLKTGTQVLLLGWKKPNMFVSPWAPQANIHTCFFGSGKWVNVLTSYLNGAKSE